MSLVEDPPKRFLADDPNFLASLTKLDRDMPVAGEVPQGRRQPPRPPALSPPSNAARQPQPAAEPPVVPAPPSIAPRASSADAPRGPRPLLDLFPVIAEEDPAVPGPLYDLPLLEPVGIAAPTPPPAAATTYETFYGLVERPFSLDASDLKFLYHGASHDQAAQTMLSAIWRREGIVVLTGELGVGKTMLCRAVMEQLDRRTLTSFIAEPFTSAEDLLKTVLVDFGVISRADLASGRLARATRAELSVALRDFMVTLAPLDAFALVIIDQAQDLPANVLGQVRALFDAEGEDRVLQIVLVGQPGLLRTLARGELKPLSQRIAVRCALGPLTVDEVGGYVGHRLSVAGASARVEFDDGAIGRVHQLSGGIPRVVNLLCDRALASGHEVSASVIDKRLIDAGAEDLDLAPALTVASIARMAALVLTLAVLVIAGAAAAAFVLRGEVAAVINEWQDIPAPPAPSPAVPAPLSPVVPPTP